MLSASTENYLKHIYYLNEGGKVTTGDLAKLLNVSPASATKMVKKLNELAFVAYTSHYGFELTETGLKAALKVLRKHRLLELFLVEKLEYSWDEVHDEACELEHHISDKFADRLYNLLGQPEFDPHGDPIPGKNGEMPGRRSIAMSAIPKNSIVVVDHVSDDNKEVLIYLDELNIKPGVKLHYKEQQSFGGSYTINIDGSVFMVGPQAAEKIFVTVVKQLDASEDIA